MYQIQIGARRRRRAVDRRMFGRFRLEWLEPRELLATYTVTNTYDNLSAGSLRSVIDQVNADSSRDIIDFAIPGTGLQTITLNSPLPTITNSVTIDGTSQATASGAPSSGPPLIAIDGSNLTSLESDLTVSASSSTIDDLAIVNCPGQGILLTGTQADVIENCFIGTPDGTNPGPNQIGVAVSTSTNTTIQGKLISGNSLLGIQLFARRHRDADPVQQDRHRRARGFCVAQRDFCARVGWDRDVWLFRHHDRRDRPGRGQPDLGQPGSRHPSDRS